MDDLIHKFFNFLDIWVLAGFIVGFIISTVIFIFILNSEPIPPNFLTP